MPKADTSVKWFHSGMTNAPVCRGEVGALIEVLDACLLDGFSTRTPDSVVVSGGVATVTIDAGNPYEKHSVIKITGSSISDLNDEWRLASSTGTVFTFACPDVADGTATGASIVRAPAGWSKPFSDTNIAAYQSADTESTQLYLRVDDTLAQVAAVRGYENMTGVSTGTGPFPTVAQQALTNFYWHKSSAANTTARRWLVVADGSFFYFYNTGATSGINQPNGWFFGDVVSLMGGDSYNCVISGNPFTAATSANAPMPSTITGPFVVLQPSPCIYLARQSNQTSLSPAVALTGQRHYTIGGEVILGANSIVAPVGAATLLRAPMFVLDSTSSISHGSIRGIAPGLIEPMSYAFADATFVPFDGGGMFSGRAIIGLSVRSSNPMGCFALDVSGPWR